MNILSYSLSLFLKSDSILVENDVEKDNEGASLSSIPQATCAYNEYRGGVSITLLFLIFAGLNFRDFQKIAKLSRENYYVAQT